MIVEEVVGGVKSWIISLGGTYDNLISRTLRLGCLQDFNETCEADCLLRLSVSVGPQASVGALPPKVRLEFGKSFALLNLGTPQQLTLIPGGYLITHVPVDEDGAYCSPPEAVSLPENMIDRMWDRIRTPQFLHVTYLTCVVDLDAMRLHTLLLSCNGAVIREIFSHRS